MRETIYVVTMGDDYYQKNKELFRNDFVTIKPYGKKRIGQLWLTKMEAFNARMELFWFNLGRKDKITIKKGVLTKDI